MNIKTSFLMTSTIYDNHMYSIMLYSVDKANRICLGPDCVVDAWHTKTVLHRMFAATLAFTESNAYHALKRSHGDFRDITREAWREELSRASGDKPSLAPGVNGGIGLHDILAPLGSQKRCVMCKVPGNEYGHTCKFSCSCGVVVCNPRTDRPCYAKHLQSVARVQLGMSPIKRARL
jgi:hypothetical protein